MDRETSVFLSALLVVALAVSGMSWASTRLSASAGFNIVCRDAYGSIMVTYRTTSRFSPAGTLTVSPQLAYGATATCGLE